ncbi:MAG TPA: ChaN family lipoprotein [Anaeromyxobacter sp.]|nr:ChaN family lipoprotein [Anaeromyxobacter sp.]
MKDAMRNHALPAAVLLLASCAATRPPADRAALAGFAWSSPLHRDHPLVGRIWDARAGRFVSEAELRAAAAGGRFVLLGETHDNADHHALQARLVDAVLAAGRRPALGFEMLDSEQQPAVDAVLAGPEPSPAALAAAVGWERSGWPAFALYAPLFQRALDARLPVVAANLSRPIARDVIHHGAGALPPALRTLLDRAGPLSPEEERARREEMAASHCGHLPEAFLGPMVLSQRARDAQLAAALAAGATGDGAVLVTGAEHAREDRGAGAFLPLAGAAEDAVVSVAFREVSPGERAPPAGPLPWDFVVFTPGVDRGDPCAGMRAPAR